MGEAVGKIYVASEFPPSAKARMTELIDNLIAAYRQSITSLSWMSEATKARALEKLEQFTPKIGHPDEFKDYSALETDPTDLVGNARRALSVAMDRELAKLGKPIDRGEWYMTPQTVNAYYNPTMNEIVFPAAILQPPFFNPEADDAVNYGAIGAVIGHEIGHGFDDQGSQYDGTGQLNNWWTDERSRGVREAHRCAHRAVQRAVARRRGRTAGQRCAHHRREHRRPRRSRHRVPSLPAELADIRTD